MTEYPVEQTGNHLSRLIDRMLKSEAVVVTRRGRPIARVTPMEAPVAPPPKIDLAWLDALRESSRTPTSGQTDTVAEMRADHRY